MLCLKNPWLVVCKGHLARAVYVALRDAGGQKEWETDRMLLSEIKFATCVLLLLGMYSGWATCTWYLYQME